MLVGTPDLLKSTLDLLKSTLGSINLTKFQVNLGSPGCRPGDQRRQRRRGPAGKDCTLKGSKNIVKYIVKT